MKYKAVIFDLDGVICHTDKYHYLAWKTLADKLGIYFDEEINNLLKGVSRMDSLEIILQQRKTPEKQKAVFSFDNRKKQELADEKNAYYVTFLKEMSEEDLSEDVKRTLFELRDRGFLLAIGSSSKNAKFILDRLGLSDFFDAVSDGNNIMNSKPHPEVFLKAAEYLEVIAESCVVVEDAVAGIEAACAAHMDSAAIGDACSCPKATYKLHAFSDLLNIVE